MPQKLKRRSLHLLVNLKKIVLFLKRKLTHQQFMLFACILVGVIAGMAAILLKLFVFKIERYVFEDWKIGQILWYQSLLPIVGIGISALLIYKVFKKNFLKGNDKIVYSIAKQSSNLPFSQTYSHGLTSGITVGFGGSLGLESPIVATGAAIGSNFGRAVLLSYKDKTLLIACGVAAGISTAFSAPIAGVLFALEVLFIEISAASFIPILISAATGALLSNVILGDEILLSFRDIQPFKHSNIVFYIGLGLFSGLIALLYTRVFHLMKRSFDRINGKVQKWLIGSFALSVLIFFFPQLYGEGYLTIKAIAETGNIDGRSLLIRFTDNQWIVLVYLFGVMILKIFASGFTIFAGGNGGSFAPTLFIGGILGFMFGRVCQMVGFEDIPMANFIVAGMGGMLSGVFFAPLTAIFLSAEVTNGYSLFIPLMVVAAISFFVVKSFESLSYEMKYLSKDMHIDVTDRDAYLLSRLELRLLIQKDYPSFLETDSLSHIIAVIGATDKDAFGVVDENEKLKGIIRLKNFKHILLENTLDRNTVTAQDLMQKEQALSMNDDIDSALHRFEVSHYTNSVLPITDSNGVLLGFVRKSAILERYRRELMNSSSY